MDELMGSHTVPLSKPLCPVCDYGVLQVSFAAEDQVERARAKCRTCEAFFHCKRAHSLVLFDQTVVERDYDSAICPESDCRKLSRKGITGAIVNGKLELHLHCTHCGWITCYEELFRTVLPSTDDEPTLDDGTVLIGRNHGAR